MGLFDRIKNVRLTNTEPNTVHNVGIDDLQEFDKRSEDWVKFNPPKIKPSIKNCRRASRFPTVYGILSNLIMKSLSSMVITGDDEEAVKHITEMDKVWDIRNMLYECAWASWNREPILGIGANNYSKISGMGTSVHNTYLQVLCEEGLLRFPLFIMPLIMVFFRTIILVLKETSETNNYLMLSFLFQIVFILYSFSGNTIVNYNNFVFYFMGVGLLAYVYNN